MSSSTNTTYTHPLLQSTACHFLYKNNVPSKAHKSNTGSYVTLFTLLLTYLPRNFYITTFFALNSITLTLQTNFQFISAQNSVKYFTFLSYLHHITESHIFPPTYT